MTLNFARHMGDCKTVISHQTGDNSVGAHNAALAVRNLFHFGAQLLSAFRKLTPVGYETPSIQHLWRPIKLLSV